MSLFKKLFQKEEKNDIEKYMDEKKEANKREDLIIVNEVPEDLIYTKQTEEGIYFFVNYWNDGTLLMHNPAYSLMDEDGKSYKRNIKLTYKLLYHRAEIIEVLVAKMKDIKKKEDAKQIFFELEELTKYIIEIELPDKEEYSIYRDMGQTEEFMENYLKICKKMKGEMNGADLLFKCVETAICEGNVESAVKWMEDFLDLFQKKREKQKDIAKKCFVVYVWECKTYFKNYKEFKSRLTEDGFFEFVDGLEEKEDRDEEPEFKEFDVEEKKMRESVDDIVKTIKENPAAAMKKWISLVQEKETSQEWEEFKEGYTSAVFDMYNIEKDALNQFVPEEAFIERHNKHFEEMMLI